MARNKIDKSQDEKYMSMKKAILFTILGIAGIIIGSNLVVENASAIARTIGISESMVALTIVALGTSLPELVTSITATRKGEYDIAIGNVVGSNIFNIGMVIGVPIAIFGGIQQFSINYIDLITMIISAFLLFIFSYNDRKISKFEGSIFLIMFVTYYGYVIYRG